MNCSARPLMTLASLIGLAGATMLLVADSTEPQCATYPGFDERFAFENTCGQTPVTGEVHFVLSDLTYSESYADQVDLRDQALAGGLVVDSISVNWDTSDCLDSQAEGVATAVGLDIELPLNSGANSTPLTATCFGWTDGLASDHSLTCTAFLEGSESQACSLTFTHIE